jgi:hypothetical protein
MSFDLSYLLFSQIEPLGEEATLVRLLPEPPFLSPIALDKDECGGLFFLGNRSPLLGT